MGLIDRPYIHPSDCTCSKCEYLRQRDEIRSQVDDILAAAKYQRDREFGIKLRRMLHQDLRCKHARPLAEGEK